MGIAAYNRGSLSISRQYCAESGCRGCVRCSQCKPTPRPATWGEKAQARALLRARRVLVACSKAGLPRPTLEMLTAILQERERVGEDTARDAAAKSLNE